MISSKVHSLSALRSKSEVRECIVFVRLDLYNTGKNCGPAAIRQRLEDLGVKPIPSCSTIAKVLTEDSLTCNRTGYYPD